MGNDVTETAEQRTFTQEEVDQIVGERLGKERSKYSDYKVLKEKAARLDELEEASKTELQKAQDAAAAAQAELERYKTRAERAEIAQRVAQDKGVPMSLITGSTKEEMEASAAALLEWKRPPAAPKVTNPGARDTAAGDEKKDARRKMASLMFSADEE